MPFNGGFREWRGHPSGKDAPYAPAETKMVIYHAVTGERLERFPVDGREMVASGEYTLTPPAERGNS